MNRGKRRVGGMGLGMRREEEGREEEEGDEEGREEKGREGEGKEEEEGREEEGREEEKGDEEGRGEEGGEMRKGEQKVGLGGREDVLFSCEGGERVNNKSEGYKTNKRKENGGRR